MLKSVTETPIKAVVLGLVAVVISLLWWSGQTPAMAQPDAAGPEISSIAITSNPDDDVRESVPYWAQGAQYSVRPSGIYGIGDSIEVTVTFNEDVTVNGAPQMVLNIGGAFRSAGYLEAEDDAVVFSYTVAEGDSDTNGVAIGANKLRLNGGSIRDAADNNADLSHVAVADQSDHRVDGIRPTISLKFLAPNTWTSDGFLTVGEPVWVVMSRSHETNDWDTAFASVAGPPQLTLDFDGETRLANWVSNNLGEMFEYVIQEGDLDTDGVAIKLNSISLNGGFIKDQAGNDAVLTHNALPSDRLHRVDAVSPYITSVAITSDPGDDDTYGTGDKIEVTVTFSEWVRISSTYRNGLVYSKRRPSLELNIGGEARTANYQNHAGPTALVFAYNVRAGDSDSDGVSIEADKLHLNDGCITDYAHNNTVTASQNCAYVTSDDVVSHDALADNSDHKVAGSTSALTIQGPTTLAYVENRGLELRIPPTEEKYVGRYQLRGTDITWSLSGDDASLFTLKDETQDGWLWSRNSLWFNSPPNYEDPEDADADNKYRLIVEATDGTNSAALEVVVVVINRAFDSDEQPVIVGAAEVGRTLTADLSRISDPWGPSNRWITSYHWSRADGNSVTEIDGADSSTYTLTADDRGHRIKVKVRLRAVYNGFNAQVFSRTSELTAAVPVPGQTNNLASGRPSISGTALVGEILTADTTAIADSDGITKASFGYQWLADDADISGATSSTYTLAAGDAGKAVKVRVSFTDDADNEETLTSVATAAVVPLKPDLAHLSVIFVGKPSGTYVGETFSLSGGLQNKGGAASAATTLRFLRSTDVTIDTSDTEAGSDDIPTLAASGRADVSMQLTAPETAGAYYYGVCVDAVADEFDTTNNCSTGFKIDVLAWNSPATGQPTISGTPRARSALSADTSSISDDDGLAKTIFSHQWLADGVTIAGATSSSYTLRDADVGKRVAVRTSFTDDAGHKESLTSRSTLPVAASQPEVTSVAVSSQPASGDTYALGETIRIQVTFSGAVATTGSPRLKIDMDPAHWGEKWAAYESGSASNELIFAHQVVEPNFSTQGIAVLANTLELNGGAITSSTTQAGAELSHAGLEHDPSHKVNWQLSRASVNRAPIFSGSAQRLDNALPNLLVSLPMRQSDFSDPDGDPLTFKLSASRDDVYELGGHVAGGFEYSDRVGRVFFLAKTSCALANLEPPAGGAFVTVITMTATDPDGASAEATATFRTNPAAFACPSLSDATVNGATVTLTFDENLAPALTKPTAAEFVVKADNVEVGVAKLSLAGRHTGFNTGNVISLTLATPVSTGQTVTVSYTPGVSPVVATFTDQPTTNNTPAAQDDHEPDEGLVSDVRSYARETQHGFDHVFRWMRVLNTFGDLTKMTIAEAEVHAVNHLAARWNPAVEGLKAVANSRQPDPGVISDVRSYARETQYGFDHVSRWMRVLAAFGDLAHMTALEAQGYADRGWQRWTPVAASLLQLEGSTQ